MRLSKVCPQLCFSTCWGWLCLSGLSRTCSKWSTPIQASPKSNFTLDNYQDERYKAASTDDFFLAFTTQKNCNWDDNLPPNSGIVHGQNWGKNFGPFAGWAFIFSQDSPPDINSASYMHLQLIEGIGMEHAEKIISKRPFNTTVWKKQ